MSMPEQINMDAVTAWRNGTFLADLAMFTSADVETYRAVYIAEMSGTLRTRVRSAKHYSPAIMEALDDAAFDKKELDHVKI